MVLVDRGVAELAGRARRTCSGPSPNGRPRVVSLDAQTTLDRPSAAAAWKTLKFIAHVVVERDRGRRQAGGRDVGQVDHRVGAAQHLGRLAVVGQVRLQHALRPGVADRDVGREHLVAVLAQVPTAARPALPVAPVTQIRLAAVAVIGTSLDPSRARPPARVRRGTRQSAEPAGACGAGMATAVLSGGGAGLAWRCGSPGPARPPGRGRAGCRRRRGGRRALPGGAGVSQPDRSGPSGTMPDGLRFLCTR